VARQICVFSSSSDAVAPAFIAAAEELGAGIARRGDGLVYGGAHVGLMGAVARGAHEAGGRIIGVIPHYFHSAGLSYDQVDELIVTQDMRERKAIMEARADAFIALPGGLGTLEETLEILTLKQVGLHQKAVILLNTNGFYEPLLALFEQIYAAHFAKPQTRDLYYAAPDVPSAFRYLDTYQPGALTRKWV
jgi:uncharacterized protein (TIGR00730 family)